MENIASDPDFEVTIAAPMVFNGSLRKIELEKNSSSHVEVVPLKAYLTKSIHLFFYTGIDKLLKSREFDLIHIWEEPYIVAGMQIAYLAKKNNVPYFFRSAQSLNKKYPFPFNFFEKYVVKNASGWNAGAHLVFKNLVIDK